MTNKDLIKFFFDETTEQLESIEQQLVELESDPHNAETIQSIFRLAHSIKGSSASLGFEVLKELTHQMEYLLDAIRQDKMEATHEVVDVLFECLDHLHMLKNAYQQEEETHDTTEIIAKIQKIMNKETGEIKKEKIETKKEEKNWEEDVYEVRTVFVEGSKTRNIRMHKVKKEVGALGEILLFDDSKLENEEKRELMIVTKIQNDVVEDVKSKVSKIMDIELFEIKKVEKTKEEKTEEKVEKNSIKQNVSKKNQNQSIRVDVNKIESLMNMVGEIIIDQTIVMQMNNELKEDYKHETVIEQEKTLKHLSRIISEFQENVMKIRMLPVEQLFSRLPRIARDLSSQLGKEINLVMEGGETELDRSVIEELTDPMIHIIRNSIDHGIEDMETREKMGKTKKGTVKITALHKDNQVVLIIEDDGVGIDPEKIKNKAIEKGVLTKAEADAMSESDLCYLIFNAGFSMAKVVSDVSGRGVGMDVVRSHIEKLNGIVELESKLGQGTKITIKLPLTLAILKGFIVELQGKTHAIPMNSVIEIYKIKEKDIQVVGNRKMVKIRENTIPLCWSEELFDYESPSKKEKNMIVMLLAVAEKRMGLIVDKLIGNQEIVVKALGSYVGKVNGISGSTILGDGKVALIIDVAGLFKINEAKD